MPLALPDHEMAREGSTGVTTTPTAPDPARLATTPRMTLEDMIAILVTLNPWRRDRSGQEGHHAKMMTSESATVESLQDTRVAEMPALMA